MRKLTRVEVYNQWLGQQRDNVLDKGSVDRILLDIVVSVLLALKLDDVSVREVVLSGQ